MKKTFTILIAALMLLTMLSQPTRLWGQTRAEAAYKTLSFPDDNNENNHVSSYTETWTATSGLASWSISNFNNNSWNNSWTYIKCGRKGYASTGTITTSFAIDKPVKSVTINIGAITSGKVTSISLYKSSDGSNWGDAVGTFTKGTGEKTVTISSPTANLYYKIEAVCTSGSGNGLLQINWVKYNVETFTVTYNSNGGSGTMTDSNSPYWTGSTVTTKTNTFTAPSGKVFNHWNTASDDSGSSYTAGESFTITANTTLYAIWSNAGDYINVDPTTKNVTCAAQNAEFTITTDQTLVANPVVFYTTSTGDVTTTQPSWIGDLTSAYSSSTLTIPVTANTGAARTAYFRVEKDLVKSDVITINQAVYAPTAPTLPAAGNFDYTKEITITAPSGTVYYTLDGTDPTSGSTAYSAPFTINATKTVKAVAYHNGYPSTVVSATYTRTYDYISSIDNTSTTYKVKGTVVAVNGTTGFVLGDGTGYVYNYKSHSLSVGDKVEINGKVSKFNYGYQFTATTSAVLTSNYTTGTPAITTLTSDIYDSYHGTGAVNLSTYFEVVGTYSNTNKDITLAGTTKHVRLLTSSTYSSLDGKTVKAKGYFLYYNSYFYICPESVEAVPTVTASVTSISNFTYNVGGGPDVKSFTVSGANLTDDLTVTASTNYKVCKTENGDYSTSVSYTPSTGTVASTTVYVRLEAGLSSNTYEGTVTVSSENADDKEIALTGTVKHTIAISGSITNGSVESDPSDAAVAGATVTLTATPDANYKLGSFTVTKAGSGTVDVTSTGANTGTYTMPADNVTVSATFTPAYTVTYVANGGSGSMTDSNSPYTAGTTVTLLTNTFTKTGCTWSSWLVKNVSTDETIIPDGDGKFEMPASAVTVTAQWTTNDYYVGLDDVDNVTLSGEYASGTLSEGDLEQIPYGTEITLSASNMADGKVFIWAITDDEDNDVTDDVLDGDVLTVPAYDITVGGQIAELFFQYSGELTEGDYIIAYTTGGGTTYVMKNTISSSRLGYETLTPSDNQIISTDASDYLWHIAPSAYYDGYWTIYNSDESKYAASNGTDKQAALMSSSDITNETKAAWSVEGSSTYDFINKYKADNSSNYKYLRNNTTSGFAVYQSSTGGANVLYKKAVGSKHSVTIATGITNGSVEASPSKAYEGQSVTLTAEPSSGYMLDSWDVYKTGDASTKVTVKGNSFTMPGYDVTVSATFRVQHTYTLVDGSSVKLEAGKHYIIANGGSGTVKVMGAHSTDPTKNGYRTYIDDVTVTSSQITEANGMYEVVFSGDDTNYWTMYDEIYGLFICSTNSSGSITHSSSISNNTKWTVSITTGAATITAQGGSAPSFRYNSSYPRFTGYTSGQQAVYLYKRDGDTDLEFYSPTTLASATIAATETYTVESGQILEVTGTLTNNGTAANLIIEDGGILVTKSSGVNATVKKNVESATNWGTGTSYDADGWYFIASPVNGAAFPTGTVDDQDIYQLDWDNNKWLNLQYSGNSALLSAGFQRGTGYLYASKAGNTLSVAGVIQPLSNDNTATVTLANDGWNLIGNPLTCKVTVDCAFSELVNASAVTNKAEGNAINPFQGIAVYGEEGDEVTFTKATTQNAVAPSNNNSLQMTLAKTITSRGEVSIKVVDNAVVSFKESKCMPKFNMIGGNTKLFIPQDDEEYSVVFSDRQGDVPLYFKANETGTYTISFAGDEMSLNGIYLIDILAEEEIDLSVNPSYTFIGSPVDKAERFKIVFKNVGSNGEDIFTYQNGNDIIVSGEGELQIFDVMGRMVSTQNVNGTETISVNAQGVYIFRLIGSEIKTQKIVVR